MSGTNRHYSRGLWLPALRADSFTVLVNAAVEGQGIALGWRQLVEDHLAASLLVSACETRLRPDHAFHLVTHPEALPSAERRAVADWIVAAFRGEA